MTVYIINLVLSCLICAGIQKRRNNQRDLEIQPSGAIGFFLLFALWVCLYTFRYKVGADSWTLNSNLEYFLENDVSFNEYVSRVRDTLFATIYYFCIKILEMRRVWFYMVMGILTYFPVIQVLRDRDEHLVFSVFIYCSTLACYSGYNGTRQAMAFGFIMLAYYKYFLKGEYKKYAVVMLIAFGFHSATLFAFPVHLLSKKSIKSPLVKWTFIGLLFMLVFLLPMWGSIINFLDFIGQRKMADDYAIYVENGANILRMFASLIPTVICLLQFPVLKERFDDNNIESLVIMSMFGTAFSFFMLRNVYFARLCAIVDVSGMFLLPKIPWAFENREAGYFVAFLMVICYIVSMILIIKSGDSHLYPYQFLPYLDATW